MGKEGMRPLSFPLLWDSVTQHAGKAEAPETGGQPLPVNPRHMRGVTSLVVDPGMAGTPSGMCSTRSANNRKENTVQAWGEN